MLETAQVPALHNLHVSTALEIGYPIPFSGHQSEQPRLRSENTCAREIVGFSKPEIRPILIPASFDLNVASFFDWQLLVSLVPLPSKTTNRTFQHRRSRRHHHPMRTWVHRSDLPFDVVWIGVHGFQREARHSCVSAHPFV